MGSYGKKKKIFPELNDLNQFSMFLLNFFPLLEFDCFLFTREPRGHLDHSF